MSTNTILILTLSAAILGVLFSLLNLFFSKNNKNREHKKISGIFQAVLFPVLIGLCLVIGMNTYKETKKSNETSLCNITYISSYEPAKTDGLFYETFSIKIDEETETYIFYELIDFTGAGSENYQILDQKLISLPIAQTEIVANNCHRPFMEKVGEYYTLCVPTCIRIVR